MPPANETGGLTYNPQTGIIAIAYLGTTGSFVHEVTHAGQFENGGLAFSKELGQTCAQDIYDELSAYRAELYYYGENVSKVTKDWLYSLTDKNGDRIYAPGGSARTASIGITISTPLFMVASEYGLTTTSWSPLYKMGGVHYKKR